MISISELSFFFSRKYEQLKSGAKSESEKLYLVLKKTKKKNYQYHVAEKIYIGIIQDQDITERR